jgi:phenylalanyl-tRNA synthetase beta chain
MPTNMSFLSSIKSLFSKPVPPAPAVPATPIKTGKFANIIVAQVTKVEKHPNADRLRVIELFDGNHSVAPVVCGAWNFDVGAKVPLALPGALIPNDQHDPQGKPFILGRAKIRGINSEGMICSGKELGVNSNGEGILILKEDSVLGSEFSPNLIKS